MRKTNKIKKHIGLLEEEINLINGYASLTKNDFSTSCRDLILRGLEHLEIAENLKDNVKFSIAKIERKQEEFDKKIMKILMLLLKQSSISKAYLENFEEKKTGKTREQYFEMLDKIEALAVKKMFERLKEKEENI